MENSVPEITLRKFSLADVSKLANLCNNIKIWNNLRDYIPFPYTESDSEAFINFCIHENPAQTFAICYNGELVGCIGLVMQTDIYKLSAELGYWIGEPFWGKGIATQAVKLITEYGFKKMGLLRIYSGVFDFNFASRKVLIKAGFKLESVAEKAAIKNKTIIDEYKFAIINSEFNFSAI